MVTGGNPTRFLMEFLARLRQDFPELRFCQGQKFTFRPPHTVIYESLEKIKYPKEYQLSLLHEVGHALLGHMAFATDSERVKMESAAWGKAQELAARYKIEFDAEFSEAQLDSYRDWLHQRSRCRTCGLTRYQTLDGVYHCPYCELLASN